MAPNDDRRSLQSSRDKIERLAEIRKEAQILEAELAGQLAEELAQELRHRTSPRSQLSKASTPKSPAPARDAPTSARGRPPTGAAGRGLQALQDQVRLCRNTLTLQFKKANPRKDGRINKEQLLAALRAVEVKTSRDAVDALLALVPVDAQGLVNPLQLLAACERARGGGDPGGAPPRQPPVARPSTAVLRPRTAAGTASPRAQTVGDAGGGSGGGDGAGGAGGAGGRFAGVQPGMQKRERMATAERMAIVMSGSISGNRITLISQANEMLVANRAKFAEAFDHADHYHVGRIPKREVQRMFVWSGLPMTLEELDEILAVLDMKHPREVEYARFMERLACLTFDLPELFEGQSSVRFAPTHLSEVIGRRVRERKRFALAALREEDPEGSGFLSMTCTLRVLKSIGLEVSETALEEVLDGLKVMTPRGVDFHKLMRVFVQDHQRPVKLDGPDQPAARSVPREIYSMVSSLGVQELIEDMQLKMLTCIKHPRDMFLHFDTQKTGLITRQQIINACTAWNLYPARKTIDELMALVDVEGRGGIDYHAFLARLAPKRTYEFMQHGDYTDSAREYIARGRFDSFARPATGADSLHAWEMAMVIRKKLAPQRALVEQMMRGKDVHERGTLSKRELLQVLRNFEVFVTHAMLDEVLAYVRFDPAAERVDYMRFLLALCVTPLPHQDEEGTMRAARRGGAHAPAQRLRLSTGRSGSHTARGRLQSRGGESAQSAGAGSGGGARAGEPLGVEEAKTLARLQDAFGNQWDAVAHAFTLEQQRLGQSRVPQVSARARRAGRAPAGAEAREARGPRRRVGFPGTLWEERTARRATALPVLGDLGSLSGGRGCQGPFYLLLKRFIAGVDRAFAAHVWSVLRKKGAVRQGGVAFFDLHAVVGPRGAPDRFRVPTGAVQRRLFEGGGPEAANDRPAPYGRTDALRPGTSAGGAGGAVRPRTGLVAMLAAAERARPGTQQSRG